eukprot:Lithocolla_globosa_v1_NODE_3219_length_1729_cov_6.909797.p1 type:complete len:556 gc:universal NODE_3219_length_1729_cov_6.909797:1671-4(-)
MGKNDKNEGLLSEQNYDDGGRGPPEWRVTIENWMVDEGPKTIFVAVWAVANFILFFQAFSFYRNDAGFVALFNLLGDGLTVARATAACLRFNCGLLLLTVCRNLISAARGTFLRKIIPFDENLSFHKLLAWSILIFTYMHAGAHMFNIKFIDIAPPALKTAALIPAEWTDWYIVFFTLGGATGVALVVVMLVLYSASFKALRGKSFETFWYIHHLFIVFYALNVVHGFQCILRPSDSGEDYVCRPQFWMWCAPGMLFYSIERLLRVIRTNQRTQLAKVIQHPSNTFELQITKPAFKYVAGQYAFINVPQISRYQWHPFTISSAPDEGFVGFHIRVSGDWTTELARCVGCSFGNRQSKYGDQPTIVSTLPEIRLDGPFSTCSEDVFNYEVSVLVGAGIGVTPFSSLLKSIWYRVIDPKTILKLRRVYFFWICRDTYAFEWFQDLLAALEIEDTQNFLQIQMYLTGNLSKDAIRNVVVNQGDGEGRDALTSLRSPTNFGRPNWNKLFNDMSDEFPNVDVGIFFCGPKPLASAIHKAAKKNTSSAPGGTRFYFNKENF